MRILYWNCTTPGNGGNSFDNAKKNFIGTVVQALGPDVVCLDEVSGGIGSSSAAKQYARTHLNGPGIAFDRPAVSKNPGAHLNTVAWAQAGVAVPQLNVGIPSKNWDSDATKRDMVHVKVYLGTHETHLWFLHANASGKGGRTAVGLVDDYLDDEPRHVFVGDFNRAFRHVTRFGTAPDVNGHTFTQWKRDEHGSATVPGSMPPMKYDPHDIIDYLIADPTEVTATAVNSVGAFSLRDFIGQFDHFPVVYDLA